jgi:hypothetical protein
MPRDLALEESWRDRIEECRRSGLSIKVWCLQNGLKDTAYHYWVKRFKILDQQEVGENKFAEVVLPPESNIAKATRPIAAKLSLSFGDYSIGIEDGFNPLTLAELVKVLRKL